MKLIQIIMLVVAIISPCLKAEEITAVSAVASSVSSNRYAANIINGSGLTGLAHSNLSTQMWEGASGDMTPYVVIDMGGLCDVNSLLIWNYNSNDASYSTYFGVKNLDVYVCQDRYISSGSTWTLVISTVLSKAPYPATFNYSSPDSVLFPTVGATHIKLLARKNYILEAGFSGTQWEQANLAGLSEVKIYGRRIDSYGIINDVTVKDFSDESLEWGFRAAENTVNGSGFENGVHCMGWEVGWQATSADVPHYIVWDLGSSSFLDSIKVWNFNAATNDAYMAAKGVGIYTSNDNVVYNIVKSATLQSHTVSSTYSTPDILSLNRVNARYVKMVINTTYGSNPQYVGLSEVQFIGYRPCLSCEETGITGLAGDIYGPNETIDCKVDFFDFAYFASRYLD